MSTKIQSNVLFILAILLLIGPAAFAQSTSESELTPEQIKTKLFKRHQRYLINNSAFIDSATGVAPEYARELLLQQSQMAVAAQANNSTNSLTTIDWVNRGPNNRAGYTSTVTFDPNDPTGKKVWAGAETGGLWYNNDISDPNSAWQLVSGAWDNMAIGDISFDQSNPQNVYATAFKRLYQSTDAGQNWSEVIMSPTLTDGSPNSITTIKDLLVVSPNELYVGTNVGVLKSTDGGQNWSRILLPVAPPTGGYLAVGPAFSATAAGNRFSVSSLRRNKTTGDLYAAFGCGEVFKSSDGGATWTSLYVAGTLNKSYTLIGLSQSTSGSGQVMYVISAVDSDPSTNHFAKTVDGGTTWSSLPWPTGLQNFQIWRNFMIEVHPTDPNVVWAGTLGLRQSINGGQSFNGIIATAPVGQADYHKMAFSPVNPNLAVIGNDQGISYWTNTQSSNPIGQSRYNNYIAYQSYNVAMHPAAGSDYMMAVAQDQPGVALSTPATGPGVSLPSGEGYFVLMDQDQPEIGYFSVFGGGRIGVVYNTQTQQSVKQLNFGAGYSDSPNIYHSGSNTLLVFNSFDQNIPGRVHFSVVNNVSTVNNASTNVLSTMYVDGIFAANGTTITGLYEHTRGMAFGHDPNTVFLFAYGGGGAKGEGLLFKITNFFSGNPVVQRINTNQAMGRDSHCLAVGQNDDEILVTIDISAAIETLWYTNNGGLNWTGLKKPNTTNITDSGLPKTYSALCATFNPLDYNQVFLGGWDGVWRCDDITDPNLQWIYSSNGLGRVQTRDIEIRPSDGRIVIATFGRGIFTAELQNNVPPTAAFTANVTSGCSPMTVQFNSTSSGTIGSYAWNFPGGTPATSTLSNPTVTYATPGTYDVELVVTGPGGTATALQNQYIQVNGMPTAAISYVVSGNTVQLTANTTLANGLVWQLGDGNSSTLAQFSHTYANDGTYTVVLQASNGCGQVLASEQILITTPPTADFSVFPSTGCLPQHTVYFTNTSSANASVYAWNFPGGTPATSNVPYPTVVYTAPGSYDVELTVTNASGSDTKLMTNAVSITPASVPGFTYVVNGTTVTFTNTSLNSTGWAWDFGDGSIGSNAADPVYTYAASGVYTVTLIAGNLCGSAPITQTIQIPPVSGTVTATAPGMIAKVAPNPSQGQIRLEVEQAPPGNWQLLATNALGQRVWTSEIVITSASHAQSFDFSTWPAGVYNLQLTNGQYHLRVAVVITH